MDGLRKPFFFITLAAMVLVVLVESGARPVVGGRTSPGLGIGYLALVDAALLFTVALMGAGLVVSQRVHARVQSLATFAFGLLLLTGAIALLVVAITRVMLMVGLFFAAPFGTIAYLIGWGSFPRGPAIALLALIMFLKLVAGGFLLAAQQRFVANKGLVALALTSALGTIVVQFLHGIVPGILVSITDGVAAIVVAVAAIVWAVVFLIGSIPGIVRAVKAVPQVRG